MFDSYNLKKILVTLFVVFLFGCDKLNKNINEKTSKNKIEKLNPMEVIVKKEMEKKFIVMPAEIMDISLDQEVAARIEVNEYRTTRIGSGITGRVTDVMAHIGTDVKKGQALAKVASPELVKSQLAFLRALSGAKLAERSVERAKQLIIADVIGNAELQRRESELATNLAELRAAEDQLEIIGMPQIAIKKLRTDGSLTSEVTIRATQSGTVVERKISQGQVTETGDPMFTVSDLSKVWVVGGLPEQYSNLVQLNEEAEVEIPALGSNRKKGKIVYISDTINPANRTVQIRTEVSNKESLLKPQMLATLIINGKLTRQLAIPNASIVREDNRDHVFVRISKNKYRLTPIELEIQGGDMRRVIKGIVEGDEIVMSGSFHLNNERKRAELE